MPRQRVRKTSRGYTDIEFYRLAYDEVKNGTSIRQAAEKHNINRMSLQRYIKKIDIAKENNQAEDIVTMGYKSCNKVFTSEQEKNIVKYLMRSNEIYFGLTPKDVRKMAYQLALEYNQKPPARWVETEMAGEEWFRSFLRRNPELSMLVTQTTSLTRAKSLNKSNKQEETNSNDSTSEMPTPFEMDAHNYLVCDLGEAADKIDIKEEPIVSNEETSHTSNNSFEFVDIRIKDEPLESNVYVKIEPDDEDF